MRPSQAQRLFRSFWPLPDSLFDDFREFIAVPGDVMDHQVRQDVPRGATLDEELAVMRRFTILPRNPVCSIFSQANFTRMSPSRIAEELVLKHEPLDPQNDLGFGFPWPLDAVAE